MAKEELKPMKAPVSRLALMIWFPFLQVNLHRAAHTHRAGMAAQMRQATALTDIAKMVIATHMVGNTRMESHMTTMETVVKTAHCKDQV